MFLSPLVAVAADCEMDISSGILEKVEATPPVVTNPAPLSYVPAPAPVTQQTPRAKDTPPPLTRAPFKGPPLPVLRFPKVSRGRGLGVCSGRGLNPGFSCCLLK